MTEPRTYRKRPVEVDAMQWTGSNAAALARWVIGPTALVDGFTVEPDPRPEDDGTEFTGLLWVAANRQWLPIETSEWVLRDGRGFYPCKAEVFAETYEPAGSVVSP